MASLLLALFAASLNAHSGREGDVRVPIPRLEAEARIDGVLDEPAWEAAARLTGFSQYAPVDGRPAADDTEVRVWYSPTAIHFGIVATAAPGSVRATLANRDAIDAEDAVEIVLGPFHDGRQALVFAVNPLGVQADGAIVEGTRSSGGGFAGLASGREPTDLSPDYVFDSKGRVTATGYEVEVRIPFKSLRYPAADTQDWDLNIVRHVQSVGHEDTWAPTRRAGTSFLQQSGTLTGLTGLRRGLVLDLNPVVTAKVDGSRDGGRWAYDGHRPEPGGNVRWGVTSNLTLNATVNPDFSQVESDAGEFSFDPRTAVFFAEKRPFFLEGIEQFTTPNQLIYTRRITAPTVSAKLTGKIAGTSVAALSAVDDRVASTDLQHHPVFNLLRVRRDLGAQSRAAFVFTSRDDGARSNQVVGVDGRFAFRKLYSLQWQGALARTRDAGVRATSPLWMAIVDRNGKRFGLRYAATGIHEDFRADSGFIARPGVVRANLDHRITFFGRQGGRVESFSTDVVLDGTWRYQDFVHGRGMQDRKFHLNNNANLRGGWKAGASVLIERFGYDPGLYADYAIGRPRPDGQLDALPFTGVPGIPNLDWLVSLNTPEFKTFSASLFYLWGRDENFFEWASADIVFGDFNVSWRPTGKLRVDGRYQVQSYKRRTDDSLVGRRRIPRLKVEYQLTRAIFLRAVGEYDASEQDDLRDDSRTGFPILVRDAVTGGYARALGSRQNNLRLDWLFSYQPRPGTVIFAGYGDTLTEPEAFRLHPLARTRDGFFLKLSYLFRM